MNELLEEKPEYIKLVKNPSRMDRLAKFAFLKALKMKGFQLKYNGVTVGEGGENYHVLRKQSYYYMENGEMVFRNIECKEKLVDSIDGISTLTQLIRRSLKDYKDKKHLGVRPVLSKNSSAKKNTQKQKSAETYHFGDYNWINYSHSQTIMDSLSLKFLDYGHNKDHRMALFSGTCPMWLLCAFALIQINSAPVTVYSTLSNDNILYALNLCEVVSVFVDSKTADRFWAIAKDVPTIKYVFCCREPNDDKEISVPDGLAIEIIYVDTDMFIINPIMDTDNKLAAIPQTPQDLVLIMFTSGSTGQPKGVMITHENILGSISVTIGEELWVDKTFLAYLPQAHILEFLAECIMTINGGCLGYGHPYTLFDTSPMITPGTKGDATALRPTFFATVPLIADRLKKGALDKIKKSSSIKQIIFETAYNIKLNYLMAGVEIPSFLDEKIFKVFREVLGGRVKYCYVGGASINRDTEYFMNVCFGIFKIGYGLTETCCGGSLSNFDYWRTGNSGPVTKCVEMKLIPWEEGNYHPSPDNWRGEICLCGKTITPGYYKNDEATAAAYVKDETTGKTWFRTGDIGEILPDGTVKIIDRKKDLIKLKTGEYVSLIYAELQILQLPYVDLVCTLPNDDCEYLVALVIPNRVACAEFLAGVDKKHSHTDMNELLKDEKITELIKNQIIKVLQESKTLDKFHTPKKFCILSDLWTPESGILTPSAKLRRPIIREKYKNLINSL